MTYPPPMAPYRSARGLCIAAVILVGLQVALDLLTAAGCVATLTLPDGVAWLSLIASGVASVLSGLLYVAAVVVFMCWIYRATANLDALGSPNLRLNPSSAVWAFFIPIVNMVRPHQVMALIWTDSQPATVNENGYALPRRTTLVTAWWSLVWVSMVLSRVLRFVDEPTTIAAVRSLAGWALVECLAWTLTGLLFIFMVWRAQQRQDEQWLDLERRRAAPQPTAQALR